MASEDQDLSPVMALNSGDDIDAIHTATATTDYSAFVGREESFSSDDSPPPRSRQVSRSRAKKSRKVQQAVSSSTKASDRPLRPAHDVLSRLRHDPILSKQNFTIGYLDRHAPDPLEMPLQNWKGGDVTDEEFIPQHRILWFKRDQDGMKVWDRKERLDLIYGSGSGALDNEQTTNEDHSETMSMSPGKEPAADRSTVNSNVREAGLHRASPTDGANEGAAVKDGLADETRRIGQPAK